MYFTVDIQMLQWLFRSDICRNSCHIFQMSFFSAEHWFLWLLESYMRYWRVLSAKWPLYAPNCILLCIFKCYYKNLDFTVSKTPLKTPKLMSLHLIDFYCKNLQFTNEFCILLLQKTLDCFLMSHSAYFFTAECSKIEKILITNFQFLKMF